MHAESFDGSGWFDQVRTDGSGWVWLGGLVALCHKACMQNVLDDIDPALCLSMLSLRVVGHEGWLTDRGLIMVVALWR